MATSRENASKRACGPAARRSALLDPPGSPGRPRA